MTLPSLPKMMFSESAGWQDLIRIHPSVSRLFAFIVAPLSVIPPAMFVYASLAHPGRVFPEPMPALSGGELMLVAAIFFAIELGMVALMAAVIQQIGETVADTRPAYEDAYTLAAVAPIPLWLSALALFVPVLWVNGLVFAAAWLASAALIYHGVNPLLHPQNRDKAHTMALFVLGTGVMAWIGLMATFAMVMSILMQWR